MRLSDFDFKLPEELIAQDPIEPRDQARLLVYTRATRSIEHRIVADLPSLLPPKTAVVANNSKVRHGRIFTEDGKEFLILNKEDTYYRCMIRGKEPKVGDHFVFSTKTHAFSLEGTVKGIENGPGMTTILVHLESSIHVESAIELSGEAPLPPYIHHSHAPSERYQTVYAGPLGSAAAPTAGLHITPELLKNLKKSGHSWDTVTLHVGLGTFLPLRNNDVESNRLHDEMTYISPSTAASLTKIISAKESLLAIGTTSIRTMESHWQDQLMKPGWNSTNLFLYPGKPIHTANCLMTNFHLPKSSLLLLLSAFLGMDAHRELSTQNGDEIIDIFHTIYSCAIKERYRFFSFGDAMLIL